MMDTLPTGLPGTRDLTRLAAAARSILSCPDAVSLVVDGLADVLAGIEGDETDTGGGGNGLGMQDVAGRPTFSCPPDVPLAVAAREGSRALLTLTSGVGPRGGLDRDAALTLAGDLRSLGARSCACCAETREVVVLDVGFVMLARTGPDAAAVDPVRVPVSAFAAPVHQLNRGFLQRSVEHANTCHQDELRRAVAGTRRRLADVVGVALADLRPDRVEVRWVEPDGAHRRELAFPRAARTADELGDLLHHALDATLC